MPNKSELILAQVFISLMMAFLMTGIFSFLALGPTTLWLTKWAQTFVMAWPVAFALSLIVGPLAFKMAAVIARHKRQPSA